MILRSTALALVWLAAAPQVEAQDLGRARPESVGLSSSGLAKATDALRAHVESGDIAGVVAAVARRGKVVYFESLGQRDLASRDEMPADGIFRLYSMTRPITSTAVMLLWEEGKFKLNVSSTVPGPACVRRRRRARSIADPRSRGRDHSAAPPDSHVRDRQPQLPNLPSGAGPPPINYVAADGRQRRAGSAVREPWHPLSIRDLHYDARAPSRGVVRSTV